MRIKLKNPIVTGSPLGCRLFVLATAYNPGMCLLVLPVILCVPHSFQGETLCVLRVGGDAGLRYINHTRGTV